MRFIMLDIRSHSALPIGTGRMIRTSNKNLGYLGLQFALRKARNAEQVSFLANSITLSSRSKTGYRPYEIRLIQCSRLAVFNDTRGLNRHFLTSIEPLLVARPAVAWRLVRAVKKKDGRVVRLLDRNSRQNCCSWCFLSPPPMGGNGASN